MNRENIIIDTDIGDDIDDALALAFALHSPEIHILGVTTVLGNTQARARIAVNLLQTAGFGQIPVYAGCGQPMNQPVDETIIPCQYSEETMGTLEISSVHAVDYLIDCIMNAPEAVTLVTIGPLTNVAVALLKEPRLKQKLKRIVMMGGAYYFHYVEWNIYCDPEAANIVFQSGIPIDAVGLDVTKQCLMNGEQLERLKTELNSPLIRLLWQLIEQWQINNKGRKYPILHDALAVYGIFGRELLQFEREAVSIELAGTATRGLTFNRTDRNREDQLIAGAEMQAERSVIQVAKAVDSQSFIDFFLNRLLSVKL
ncbi:nucleoside hydrolase [Paenibacillus psychroresistens]|uniref:Nucleoside hydrolase n=1 Tax=Paenibacillus psychroresistens TaxID=1778678 RepID=A0A6B8RS47_9BACL|nr:nucleoside hydrolase [Paenibacillus psychroresistens]QGQ98166.1 nucleoside hydrolase [Paenibacillus psychroresistens]